MPGQFDLGYLGIGVGAWILRKSRAARAAADAEELLKRFPRIENRERTELEKRIAELLPTITTTQKASAITLHSRLG